MTPTVRIPRELVGDALAYIRCVKTDEAATDRVSLGWPSSSALRRLAPSATALIFGRPLSSLLLSTPVPQGEVSAVLLWSTETPPRKLELPVGPTVTAAFRRLRVAAWLWLICAVLILLLTGAVALAVLPPVAYIAYRQYTLRRYWIRGRLRDGDDLEMRDVSAGFGAHVESVLRDARTRG